MGLDAGFLQMLTAPVGLRRRTGKDQWGNEVHGAVEQQRGYIATSTTSYGDGTQGGQTQKKAVVRREVLMDALGITVEDILVIDGVECGVEEVQTEKDEVGDDLYQTITVVNEKKG